MESKSFLGNWFPHSSEKTCDGSPYRLPNATQAQLKNSDMI